MNNLRSLEHRDYRETELFLDIHKLTKYLTRFCQPHQSIKPIYRREKRNLRSSDRNMEQRNYWDLELRSVGDLRKKIKVGEIQTERGKLIIPDAFDYEEAKIVILIPFGENPQAPEGKILLKRVYDEGARNIRRKDFVRNGIFRTYKTDEKGILGWAIPNEVFLS